MKFGVFVLVLVINLAGLVLADRVGGYVIVIPVLSIAGGVATIFSNDDPKKSGLGWWAIWGTLATYPVAIVIMILSGVRC